ncbi:hypothetical protein D3C72_1843910 [compost metagenome]
MATDIACDLAAAGGMADQNDVVKIELFDQFGQIVGILIHVIVIPDLVGAAVAAAVMGDGAETVVGEEHHLRIPCIGAERPAVGEDDGLAVFRTPVLVEDVRSVSGGDRCHGSLSCCRELACVPWE